MVLENNQESVLKFSSATLQLTIYSLRIKLQFLKKFDTEDGTLRAYVSFGVLFCKSIDWFLFDSNFGV